MENWFCCVNKMRGRINYLLVIVGIIPLVLWLLFKKEIIETEIFVHKNYLHKKPNMFEDHEKLHESLKTFDPKLLFADKAKLMKGLNAGMLTRIKPLSTDLNKTEQDKVDICIKNQPEDYKQGFGKFWTGNTQYVRHSHHKYLNNKSIILDIGGNIGIDAKAMVRNYKPGLYIILEPVDVFYKKLVQMFETNKNVVLYQIGLAKENGEFQVEIKNDGTSVFLEKKGKGGTQLKTVNATNFFINIGIGFYDIDLITVNCEGCEFDVIESLVSSTLINHFKHVQFATHTFLTGLQNAVSRYCKIQELLARTHIITYQYKFTWESWKRKDQLK